jgi:hypothetical protein
MVETSERKTKPNCCELIFTGNLTITIQTTQTVIAPAGSGRPGQCFAAVRF